MTLNRTKLMLVVAVVFAIMAAWLANNWVQRRAATSSDKTVEVKTVVVAKLEIASGQKVEAVQLKTVEWPKELVPEGAVEKVEDAIGKIAKQPIQPGDVITATRVADDLGGSHLAALIANNKRAIAVRVDDVVGVAGFLLPGNRVDVIGVVREDNTRRVTAKTVLTDVPVLAVDQDISPDESKAKIVRAVTLEVAPEEAEMLVKAMNEGKIQLSLRNPGERQVVAEVVKPVVKPKPKPKLVAKAPERIEVILIRGTEVTEVETKS